MDKIKAPVGQSLLTLGQLSEEVRKISDGPVSTHQVDYAVREYKIEPVGKVGILRVWTADAIPRVRSALARIAANRGDRL